MESTDEVPTELICGDTLEDGEKVVKIPNSNVKQEIHWHSPQMVEFLTLPHTENSLVVRKPNQYFEITNLLAMSQSAAARELGIPTSTLGKRWKEAANRKWHDHLAYFF